MTDPVWKTLPGFGGHYEISDAGDVRVKGRFIVKPHSQSGKPTRYFYDARVLQPTIDAKGYRTVHIGVDKKKTKLRVSRAVLLAFVGSAPDGMEACHNNGISHDDRLLNLRWDTHLENNRDRLRHGTYTRGAKHPMVKFSEADVRSILAGAIDCKTAVATLGISVTHFYRIRKGASWSHL